MARVAPKTDSGSPHAARLQRLREALRERDAGHALITDPFDVGYLTGFLGGDSYLFLSADAERRPVIISDGRYEAELEPFAPIADIHIRTGSFAQAIAEHFSGVDRCLVQADHLTVAEFNALGAKLGKKKLVPVAGLTAPMRNTKDEGEVKRIRAAVKVQEKALLNILPEIRPGMTELSVAAMLEAEMKLLGASEPGFPTIVATGANAALPHYRPGKVKISKSKALLIDWGCVVDGYHCDMCRCFAFGSWPKQIAEIYDIVLEAQQAAADALAPGKTNHEIDAVARNIIERAGYGPQFNHGLGHGFGLQNKEDPRLNPLYPEQTLEPGHVVTIEPGIYLPGVGGVRLEDDFVVTDRGAKNLSTLPTSLNWATLDTTGVGATR